MLERGVVGDLGRGCSREGGWGDLGRGGGMYQQKYCKPNLSRRQSVVHDILVFNWWVVLTDLEDFSSPVTV